LIWENQRQNHNQKEINHKAATGTKKKTGNGA
jgi:hypothetical protein